MAKVDGKHSKCSFGKTRKTELSRDMSHGVKEIGTNSSYLINIYYGGHQNFLSTMCTERDCPLSVWFI